MLLHKYDGRKDRFTPPKQKVTCVISYDRTLYLKKIGFGNEWKNWAKFLRELLAFLGQRCEINFPFSFP